MSLVPKHATSYKLIWEQFCTIILENLAELTGGDCDSEDAWIGIIATGVSEGVRYNGSTDWERISRGIATWGKESLSRDVRCRRLRVEDGNAAGSQLNGAYDVVDAGDTWGSGIHCICHKTEGSSTYIHHSIKSCKSVFHAFHLISTLFFCISAWLLVYNTCNFAQSIGTNWRKDCRVRYNSFRRLPFINTVTV